MRDASQDGQLIPDINPEIPQTWPKGDKLWQLAMCIAIAEGYNLPNSVPARLCNPGDISDWAETFGDEEKDGSRVTHFPNQYSGWFYLRHKLMNIFSGKSKMFYPDMTFEQFAKQWAGDWQAWCDNVCRSLGSDVGPQTKLSEWWARCYLCGK